MIQKLAFTWIGLSIENWPFPFHTHRDAGLKVDESSFVQVELFHNTSDKIFIYSIFNNLDLEHSADMELLFTPPWAMSSDSKHRLCISGRSFVANIF